MDGPLFTVVMPVHDAAGTVAEAIASIRAQTCVDWELVLVDDASGDDSMAVAAQACQGMAQSVTAIACGGSEAVGPAAARNDGLALASGRLVAFLDADDRWEPDLLAVRAANFTDHPEIALAWGPTVYWYPDRSDRSDYVDGVAFSDDERVFGPGEVVRYWLHSLRQTPCVGPTVVRRDAAKAAGGFPASLRRGEDIALWLSIGADSAVLWDHRVLHRYRRHGNSSTTASRVDGSRASHDLEQARWAVAFARRHPELDCGAVAARNLHGLAQQAAADRAPVVAQFLTSAALLSVPGARRYAWWLITDWLLPRRLARRVVSFCYDWSGANRGGAER